MQTNSNDAAAYLRREFDPKDFLAVVLINKQTHRVMQRIGTSEKIASAPFQAWLHEQNRHGWEIYVSMNALRLGASGRTKADIATVRHIFLDLDENGDNALRDIRQRVDLPPPSAVLNTSDQKWQVVWRVENFTKDGAERLQRALARDVGADPAATDCARVLRMPGFQNHKYGRPFLVRVAFPSEQARVYQPEDFPIAPALEKSLRTRSFDRHALRASGSRSQSERDWAFAKRALRRGEPEHLVIAAIASFRSFEKHDPQYYAELTVHKARESLHADRAATVRFPVVGER